MTDQAIAGVFALLGVLVVTLSLGCLRLWNRVVKAECTIAHLDDVARGLAGQIVTLGSRGTSNTVVAADWNVEPADVSDGIETKVYGD